MVLAWRAVKTDAVLRSNLGDGFVFLDRLLDDFGFKSGRVLFSHGSSSLTYFCPISCLNSWSHYRNEDRFSLCQSSGMKKDGACVSAFAPSQKSTNVKMFIGSITSFIL